jgi:hypothetical protein
MWWSCKNVPLCKGEFRSARTSALLRDTAEPVGFSGGTRGERYPTQTDHSTVTDQFRSAANYLSPLSLLWFVGC